MNFGVIRGVRGTRVPIPISKPDPVSKPEVSFVSGEQLLRELEEERNRLWREERSSNKKVNTQPKFKREFSRKDERSFRDSNSSDREVGQKIGEKDIQRGPRQEEKEERDVRQKKEFVQWGKKEERDVTKKKEFVQNGKKNVQSYQKQEDKEERYVGQKKEKGQKNTRSYQKQEDRQENEDRLVITSENQFQILNQIICPLLEVPYEEQLELKSQKHDDLVARLSRLNSHSRPANSGRMIRSDVLVEYRTRDEFGIQKV